jgi:hypothetical protein
MSLSFEQPARLADRAQACGLKPEKLGRRFPLAESPAKIGQSHRQARRDRVAALQRNFCSCRGTTHFGLRAAQLVSSFAHRGQG